MTGLQSTWISAQGHRQGGIAGHSTETRAGDMIEYVNKLLSRLIR